MSLSKTLYPLFSNSCVDPECFVSGGPTLKAFYLFIHRGVQTPPLDQHMILIQPRKTCPDMTGKSLTGT